jgi:hypothetical protein
MQTGSMPVVPQRPTPGATTQEDKTQRGREVDEAIWEEKRLLKLQAMLRYSIDSEWSFVSTPNRTFSFDRYSSVPAWYSSENQNPKRAGTRSAAY